jgi:hypothetical protein
MPLKIYTYSIGEETSGKAKSIDEKPFTGMTRVIMEKFHQRKKRL